MENEKSPQNCMQVWDVHNLQQNSFITVNNHPEVNVPVITIFHKEMTIPTGKILILKNISPFLGFSCDNYYSLGWLVSFNKYSQLNIFVI